MTPRVKKNTVKSTLLNLQCRPVPITIHYDMNYVYEITLYVICEMYNFIICEIYDSIFIYENSHMKLPKFTYEMDFIYEISFFICEVHVTSRR
jgi:presenilin-like A22 family membrane protease